MAPQAGTLCIPRKPVPHGLTRFNGPIEFERRIILVRATQRGQTMKFAIAASLLALASTQAYAQVNAGNQAPEASMPFKLTQITTFNLPWRMAFLPDGRMLVTEKVGPVWLVTQKGEKIQVENTPAVYYQGQNGMHAVYLSPRYATDHSIYLTYAEPGDYGGGLALARAKRHVTPLTESFSKTQVLGDAMPTGA